MGSFISPVGTPAPRKRPEAVLLACPRPVCLSSAPVTRALSWVLWAATVRRAWRWPHQRPQSTFHPAATCRPLPAPITGNSSGVPQPGHLHTRDRFRPPLASPSLIFISEPSPAVLRAPSRLRVDPVSTRGALPTLVPLLPLHSPKVFFSPAWLRQVPAPDPSGRIWLCTQPAGHFKAGLEALWGH